MGTNKNAEPASTKRDIDLIIVDIARAREIS